MRIVIYSRQVPSALDHNKLDRNGNAPPVPTEYIIIFAMFMHLTDPTFGGSDDWRLRGLATVTNFTS